MAQADGYDGLAALGVAGDVYRRDAAEALRPLRPVHQQQPAGVFGVAGVRHLAVRVRRAHMLGDDHRDAFDRAEHPGEDCGVRSQLVHRAEGVRRLRADEGVDVHDPRQLGRADAVAPRLRPHLVEQVVVRRRAVVYRHARVVHQRQMHNAVVAEQPVRLAGGGRRDGRAVRVDVVRGRGVGVQYHVVERLGGVSHKGVADFAEQGRQRVVLFEREAEGDLRHQLARGERHLAGGERGVGRRRVLRARVEVHVAELGRDVERLAGHREHGDEPGDEGLQVDVHPQLGALEGGDEVGARAGGGGVHRRADGVIAHVGERGRDDLAVLHLRVADVEARERLRGVGGSHAALDALEVALDGFGGEVVGERARGFGELRHPRAGVGGVRVVGVSARHRAHDADVERGAAGEPAAAHAQPALGVVRPRHLRAPPLAHPLLNLPHVRPQPRVLVAQRPHLPAQRLRALPHEHANLGEALVHLSHLFGRRRHG